MKRVARLWSLALLGALVAVGCGGSGGSSGVQSSAPPDTLNFGIQAEITTMDPYESTAYVDRQVMASIYDKLVDIDGKGEIEPMLAKDWEVSDDELTYTFDLRDDVEFHDGTKFDAEAAKFNLDRYLEEESARVAELASVKSVEAVDSNTLRINLSEPFSPLLSVLADRAGMMPSPQAVQQSGDDFANNPVGTGPFEFDEQVRGDELTVKAFDGYWREGQPKLKEVSYQGIEDANVQYNNLQSGQLDVIELVPENELESLKERGGFDIYNRPELGYQGIWLNTTQPPFDDANLRRAVYTLIDREAIVEAALSGVGGEAGNSPFPPVSFAYGESDEFKRGNAEEARQLLKEAGQGDGFSFTMTVGTSPQQQQIGQIVQDSLEPAGIKVDLERLEFGTLLEGAERKDFEALQLGWSGRLDPDQNIYEFLTTGDPSNYSGYSNKEFDKLLAEARREGNEDERKRLYDDAMKILHDEAPYIYLYHENSTWGMNQAVEGYEFNPDGIVRVAEISKSGEE